MFYSFMIKNKMDLYQILEIAKFLPQHLSILRLINRMWKSAIDCTRGLKMMHLRSIFACDKNDRYLSPNERWLNHLFSNNNDKILCWLLDKNYLSISIWSRSFNINWSTLRNLDVVEKIYRLLFQNYSMFDLSFAMTIRISIRYCVKGGESIVSKMIDLYSKDYPSKVSKNHTDWSFWIFYCAKWDLCDFLKDRSPWLKLPLNFANRIITNQSTRENIEKVLDAIEQQHVNANGIFSSYKYEMLSTVIKYGDVGSLKWIIDDKKSGNLINDKNWFDLFITNDPSKIEYMLNRFIADGRSMQQKIGNISMASFWITLFQSQSKIIREYWFLDKMYAALDYDGSQLSKESKIEVWEELIHLDDVRILKWVMGKQKFNIDDYVSIVIEPQSIEMFELLKSDASWLHQCKIVMNPLRSESAKFCCLLKRLMSENDQFHKNFSVLDQPTLICCINNNEYQLIRNFKVWMNNFDSLFYQAIRNILNHHHQTIDIDDWKNLIDFMEQEKIILGSTNKKLIHCFAELIVKCGLIELIDHLHKNSMKEFPRLLKESSNILRKLSDVWLSRLIQ